MDAGSLDEKITILQLIHNRNDFGEVCDTYKPTHDTKAHVIDNSGNKVDQNHETFYTYTKQFQIRRYVKVEEFWRVLYRGKMWNILSISEDRIMNQKILTCELVNE